jgi:hypothetical protein
MQVSDCNLGVDLYAAGGWTGLSKSDRLTILKYGDDFRQQLRPVMGTGVRHGGFIMPCLVHCVSGYGFWSRGSIGEIAPSAAFLKWCDSQLVIAFLAFKMRSDLLFCSATFSGSTRTAAYGCLMCAVSRTATHHASTCAGEPCI